MSGAEGWNIISSPIAWMVSSRTRSHSDSSEADMSHFQLGSPQKRKLVFRAKQTPWFMDRRIVEVVRLLPFVTFSIWVWFRKRIIGGLNTLHFYRQGKY